MDIKDAIEWRITQRVNEGGLDDLIQAEWTRIHLLQISDDPWAETRWAELLNLKEVRHKDPTCNEPTIQRIHPELAAKIKRRTDCKCYNADVEEVLIAAKATLLVLGCKGKPPAVKTH